MDETFLTTAQSGTLERLRTAHRLWAESIRNGHSPQVGGLMFGPRGSGKTHILERFAQEVPHSVFVPIPYMAEQDTFRTVMGEILQRPLERNESRSLLCAEIKKRFSPGLALLVSNATDFTNPGEQDVKWMRGLLNTFDGYRVPAFCVFASCSDDRPRFETAKDYIDITDRMTLIWELEAPSEKEQVEFAHLIGREVGLNISAIEAQQIAYKSRGDLKRISTLIQQRHFQGGPPA